MSTVEDIAEARRRVDEALAAVLRGCDAQAVINELTDNEVRVLCGEPNKENR